MSYPNYLLSGMLGRLSSSASWSTCRRCSNVMSGSSTRRTSEAVFWSGSWWFCGVWGVVKLNVELLSWFWFAMTMMMLLLKTKSCEDLRALEAALPGARAAFSTCAGAHVGSEQVVTTVRRLYTTERFKSPKRGQEIHPDVGSEATHGECKKEDVVEEIARTKMNG